MTRSETIRLILTDLLHGETTTIRGFLDYLLFDLHLPLGRILDIGARRLRTNRETLFTTLTELYR